MISEKDIYLILARLKSSGDLPKHIEKTHFKSIFFYNVYSAPFGQIMSYHVSTGVDRDEKTALLKSLVEHIERKAFDESEKASIFPLHNFSDGFAAFPKSNPNFKHFARENALSEATERYVWANWWNEKSAAKIAEVTAQNQTLWTNELLSTIEADKIFQIEPCVENSNGIETVILFIKLKSGGFISGGAAGTNKESTLFRASSEAIRHYLGFQKYREHNLSLTHFYERRLIHFAMGLGNDKVLDRLANLSTHHLTLPNLVYDQRVQHKFDDIVYVHRCLFEKQPLFVGGELDRLCL